MTQQAELAAVVDRAVAELGGRLDVFVANAGVPWTKGALLDAADHAHYRAVMAADLDSVYYSAFAAGRHFRAARAGSFIATASMSGHVANVPQMQAAYNAAKAGVIHFCRSLAVEWAPFGARANSVSPGYILTDISAFVDADTKAVWAERTPMHREGRPEELKGAYLYFASDASSFTTGSDLVVDG